MTTVGANWYILSQTHSNKIVGFYLTINVLAGFIMSPLAGSITDRFSRKKVILWSFIGRVLPIIFIAIYFYILGFNLILMYILSIVMGMGWITYMAASRSYVQSSLPDNLLGSANSFIEISLQVGMFSAGALSGIILNYTGFVAILVINALVFLLAIILVNGIKNDATLDLDIHKENFQISKGIKYVWNNKLIFNIGILSILPLIVTQLFNVSAPDYVSSILKANSVVYGLSDMSYGIGGLVAGIVSGYLINRFSSKKLIINFFALASLVLITLFVGRSIVLMYLCNFILGLSNSSLRVSMNTILMSSVKKTFMGRVTSIFNGLAQLIEVFASTLMGTFNDKMGANFGFLVMFVIMIIGVVASTMGIKNKAEV
ncbi:MFS transporter [Lactobacillus bombi]|nr:MFS transporter [Bombilactobacillus bombi]